MSPHSVRSNSFLIYSSETSMSRSQEKGFSFRNKHFIKSIDIPGPQCYNLLNDSCLSKSIRSPRVTMNTEKRQTHESFIMNESVPGVGAYSTDRKRHKIGPSFALSSRSNSTNSNPGPSDYKPQVKRSQTGSMGNTKRSPLFAYQTTEIVPGPS
jgi:hypothetical protein